MLAQSKIDQAIQVLKAAGYRVTKAREKAAVFADGRPTTTKWPPARGERYVGVWPPVFKSNTYRPRPLNPNKIGTQRPIFDWTAAEIAAFVSKAEIEKAASRAAKLTAKMAAVLVAGALIFASAPSVEASPTCHAHGSVTHCHGG